MLEADPKSHAARQSTHKGKGPMSSHELAFDTQQIKQLGLDRMEDLCRYLLPAGRKEGKHWKVGNSRGDLERALMSI